MPTKKENRGGPGRNHGRKLKYGESVNLAKAAKRDA